MSKILRMLRSGYPCPDYYNPADHFILTLAIQPGKAHSIHAHLSRLFTESCSCMYFDLLRPGGGGQGQGGSYMRLIPHIRGRFALSTLSHLERANTKLIYVHFNMHPLVDLNGGKCVQEGRTLAAEIEQMKKMIVPADKKAGAGASPYKVFLQKPNSWNVQF